jgi:hypothetical protein
MIDKINSLPFGASHMSKRTDDNEHLRTRSLVSQR